MDTGHTLDFLRRTFLARNPASLKTVALLDKKSRREREVPVEYIGFEIPDRFVVGYGLDFAERFRHLPYIAALSPEELTREAPVFVLAITALPLAWPFSVSTVKLFS